MSSKDGIRDALRAMLFENLALKIVSLLFAFALYAFIHGAENAQRTFAMPVVAVLPADTNRILMTQLPTEIAVTVRGSRTQLDGMRSEDLGSIRLDLKGFEQRIELTEPMIHVPPGVAIAGIHPPSITLRWDEVMVRQLPVQIPRTGEVGPGLRVRGTKGVDPAAVTARGPRSVVEVMQVARTVPFDVTGLPEGSHRRRLKIEEPPKLVTYDVDSAETLIEIAREQRELPLVKPIEVVGMPRASTKPDRVRIVLRGTPEQVNAVQQDAILARVEPKAAGHDITKGGSDYLPVLVDVPQHLQIVEVVPQKVLVKW